MVGVVNEILASGIPGRGLLHLHETMLAMVSSADRSRSPQRSGRGRDHDTFAV